MRHRTRRRVLCAILLAAIVLTGLTSSEFAARLWVVTHPKAERLPSDFAAEQHTVDYSNRLTDDGYWTVGDFAGKYFAVKDGIRITVNQPQANRTIWLFGNSAMFGLTVGTGQTIADYLQAQIKTYKVVNLGMIAADASLQTIRLKHTPIRADDIVVFMDGNVDAAEVVIKANRLYSPICRNYNQLAIIELSCSWLDARIAPMIDNQATRDALINYNRAIQSARAYSTQHGAMFYHFFTPDFAGAQSDNLAEIVANADDANPDNAQMIDDLYKVFRVADPQVHDLRHALDGSRGWFDISHPNATGNAIVARAIADAVWRTF